MRPLHARYRGRESPIPPVGGSHTDGAVVACRAHYVSVSYSALFLLTVGVATSANRPAWRMPRVR